MYKGMFFLSSTNLSYSLVCRLHVLKSNKCTARKEEAGDNVTKEERNVSRDDKMMVPYLRGLSIERSMMFPI